tara:strand:+ start:574 stop:1077 length:504 start_codon:yes stop_codon:yes gene_type:complete
MEKLSKEELLALLNNKPKKERKKPNLSEDKKIEMLERLADMRETVKKNREAKKELNPSIKEKEKEKEIEAIFEKKYSSQFDKMNSLLTDLNENTKEVVKIKREKLAKKEEAKKEEEKKTIEPPKVQPVLEIPKLFNNSVPVHATAMPIPIPVRPINPNIHRKGNTRF